MKSHRLIFASAMLVVSSQISAQCNEIYCDGKIDKLYLRNLDSVFIESDQDISNLDCSPYGDKYITLEGDHQNADRIYAALLTAKTTNGNVRLRIIQGSSNCAIDYVLTID